MFPEVLVQNYKCFGAAPTALPALTGINVIVGRNNSGKSALIDVVEYLCSPRDIPPSLNHMGKVPQFQIRRKIPEAVLRRIFQENTSGGDIGGNHWAFGKQFLDRDALFTVTKGNCLFSEMQEMPTVAARYLQSASGTELNPFGKMNFCRLSADRDVSPEADAVDLSIAQNGRGFTNVVQRFLTKSFLPSELIREELLVALNAIFFTDTQFSRIEIQQHENGTWEIFLEERGKGFVPLGHSGSGLKTVLLVLGMLICVPKIANKKISEYVFAFEELENNMHPALQRRLVGYIQNVCREQSAVVLLTTHSSAIIDALAAQRDCQILHVTHSGECAAIRSVSTYVDRRGVIDDLDVRASDLLQANGVIWVEGPSDRLYLNLWLNLISGGLLREGIHYQCVFYGGRLLAHLSGEEPFGGSGAEAVHILAVNKNAAIVIDSDRKCEEETINSTKQRMVDEITHNGGLVWVTLGREIENYVSPSVLARRFPGISGLGQFNDIGSHLDNWHQGEGDRFRRNKMLYAEQFTELTTRDDLDNHLDLGQNVLALAAKIAAWNGIDLAHLTSSSHSP